MNNYDLTVGDGMSENDQNPSGMFDYVTGMASGGDVDSDLFRILNPEQIETAPEFAPQQAVDAAFDSAFNKQADVVQNLQQAGVQEKPADIPSVIQPSTAQTAQPKSPFEAFQLALKSPTQTQFGQYTVTPRTFVDLNPGYDLSEEQIETLGANKPQYYTISGMKGKTDNGLDYEQNVDYDPQGNFAGYQVNVKSGADSGTILNYGPKGELLSSTGYDKSESWRKPVSMAVALFGSALGAPYIGQTLFGLSGAAGAMAGGATIGGLSGAAAGLEGSDLLKAAAVSGLGAGAGELGNVAGKAAGDFASNLFSGSPDAASLARDIVSGAVKGGISSLPGAISTGDASGILTGGLMGGAGGAFTNLTEGLASYGIKPTQIQAGINIARGLQSGNTNAILNSLGGLLDSKNVDIAGKAFVAFDAVRSGNPIKAAAAIMQLGNTFKSGAASKSPSSQEISQSDVNNYKNIYDSISNNQGDGSEVTEEDNLDSNKDESVAVKGQYQTSFMPGYLYDPLDETVHSQRVNVTEKKIPVGDQFLDSLISQVFTKADTPTQFVPVTGQKLKDLGNAIDTSVDVADQKVDVTGKNIGPNFLSDEGLIPPEKYKPPEVPKAEEIKTPPKVPITIPGGPSSPKQTDVRQTVGGQQNLTSLGALPLFESIFYQQRMREQQLADLMEQEENQDPYEVLMRMAERNPEVAVDELMRIIEGA
jgi:hypothetical protein